MKGTEVATAERRLESVRERFEEWRSSSAGGRRIPAELWAAAIDLTRDHTMNRIARKLRLNQTELKLRAEHKVGGAAPGQAGRFIELNVADTIVGTGAAGAVVDLEDRSGRRIRITLDRADAAQVLEWAGRVWTGCR